jgi:hypothetical protein
MNGTDEFNKSFKSCVWGSETPEEFEETWKFIIARFELEKNEWLLHMFTVFERCGSPHTLNTFFGWDIENNIKIRT